MELWHGYDAAAFGYDEQTRLATRALFDTADVFIITLGLSEVWYDEPTGEVFWRAVPAAKYDATRHRFRVTTVDENQANLASIDGLIRRYRPDAHLVLTLSPVPLTATFRDVSCVTANAVSKAVLRVAIDQFLRARGASDGAYLFPSYEIVTAMFQNAFMEDRKHPHQHVLDLNMKAFERYFCVDGASDRELSEAFERAQILDRQVGVDGHFAVPRNATPPAGGAVVRPRGA